MNKPVKFSKELVSEMRKLLRVRTGNTAYRTVSKRLAKGAASVKVKKQQSGSGLTGQAEARVSG
jgi:hypothetical protein